MQKRNVPERARVRILTVSPASRRIEGGLRDGGTIQITVIDVGPLFRWPVEGEQWNVVRRNNAWMLDGSIQGKLEDTPIEDLDPGEAKIDADNVYTKTSRLWTAEDASVQTPIPFPFSTGWSNFATGFTEATYYKDRNRVYLDGTVKYTSGGTATIGILPVGYRPSGSVSFAIPVFASRETLLITAAGVVTSQFIDGASKVLSSLDGVSFRV